MFDQRERIITRHGVRYKLVPPEGGWGFMICLSIAIQFTALFAPIGSFGIIYNDFLVERGAGTSGVTLVFGVSGITLSITGFISNVLLKWLTLRQVALLGSAIFCLGNFLGIFVKSVNHIVITNGLIQAGGIGLVFPICYTIFNTYFTLRRLPYLSAIKVFVGIWSVVTPLLVKISLDEYGFRGTLVMVFAVGLHSILASAMLQPVDWHLKMVEIKSGDEETEDTPLKPDPQGRRRTLDADIKRDGVPVDVIKENNENTVAEKSHPVDASYDSAENKLTTSITRDKLSISWNETNEKGESISKTTVVDIQDEKYFGANMLTERGLSYERMDSQDEEYIANLVRACSIMSLSNLPGNVPLEPLPPIMDTKGRLKLIVDYFDLSLFKDLVYTNICFGMAVAAFSDGTFFSLLPLFLYNIGWDSASVAKAMSLAATGDMVARGLLVIVSRLVHINSRYTYLAGVLITILLRCVFGMVSEAITMLVIFTAMGFVRCLMHVTSPLVLADQIPIHRYPAAYGLFLLVYGLINLLVGPLIGMIRDLTGSYTLVFNIMIALLIIFATPWLAEIYYKKRKATTLKEDPIVKTEKPLNTKT